MILGWLFGKKPEQEEEESQVEEEVRRKVFLAEHFPVQWIRERKGSPRMRVEFRQYQEWSTARGEVLRMPRKVRVYQGKHGSRLALGVRRFRPGASGGTMPAPEDLPGSVLKFRRTPLPGDGVP